MRLDASERVTDVYLITMLLIFPLFFGFSGYSQITVSKFIFLLAATGAWLASLLVAVPLQRRRLDRLRPVQWAAMAAGLTALLSWLLCGDRTTALLGAGRFDGLLTTLVYVLIFLGVSAFSRPKQMHLRAAAAALTLMLALALAQLAGFNPLRLYPGDLNYFDHGIRYSGVYLGTIGNTNVLDAILCLALPVLLARFIFEGEPICLVPAVLAVPVLWKAGGDGLKLSLLLTVLAAPPLLLTDLPRVRRALAALAWLLSAAAFGALWQPDASHALRFAFSLPAALLLASAAVCALLSRCPLPASFSPRPKTLRRFFLILSCAALLLGTAAIAFIPWRGGTLYEFREMLHGRVSESFGSNRIRIWRACLDLVPRRPFLGLGPGMLAANVDVEFSRYVPETGETLYSFVDNAHNVYLAALVNTGVFGLLAHLTLLALAGAEALRRRGEPAVLPLALGLFCASIHAFFGLGLCLSEPLYYLALGLLCAGRRKAKRP